MKSYLKCSDRELFERLESDWKLQMFCKIQIQPGSNLSYKIMTDIRKRISQVFDLQELQKVIIEDWKYEIDANSILMDATVFESNVKYPKDMDLLQDSIY